MPKMLVVDDSPVDRRFAATLLEEAGFQVVTADNGRKGLEAIAQEHPDVVLTDMQMPEIDGLELVIRVRQQFPSLPVILMTAHGSERFAVKALQNGAASYVPKFHLGQDLVSTVQDVLSVAHSGSEQRRIFTWLEGVELRYVIGAEINGMQNLIGHIEMYLRNMNLCDDGDLVRVGTALHEALVNAVEHGNLELDSRLKEDGSAAFRELAVARSIQKPYCDRHVNVLVKLTRDEAVISICDEGKGFDPSQLPDPTDPENLDRPSGRGLLLIRTFMDEVRFSPNGNEITLIKRRTR